MGNFFYNYEEPKIIMQANSFAPTDKTFEYVIEVYDNDDDSPGLNMYRFNRVKYNH
jgi:hypothetical protein